MHYNEMLAIITSLKTAFGHELDKQREESLAFERRVTHILTKLEVEIENRINKELDEQFRASQLSVKEA